MEKQLFPLLLLLLGFAGQAQESNLKLGLQAGFSVNDFYLYRAAEIPESIRKYSPVANWQLGITADFTLMRSKGEANPILSQLELGLQPMWTRRSVRGYPASEHPSSEQINIHYLDIPLLLRYRAHSGLFVEGGPVLGLRVGISPAEIKEVEERFNTIFYDHYSLGLAAGVGYAVNKRLAFSLRTFHSLRNVMPEVIYLDSDGNAMPTQPLILARSVQCVVTYGLWGHGE